MSALHRAGPHRVVAFILLGCSFILNVPYPVTAQVATNITSSGLNTQVGAPVTLPNGQVLHDITGGTRPGGGVNLFHSFGELNVGNGNIANFLNDSGLATNNILGRVTGGNPSNIFGTLQTSGFGNANLFLINPAGVLFGPTASLNIGGTVSVSTANYLKLADGVRFNAMPGASDALLSAAPVAAFGFLGNTPAAIAVNGSTLTVAEGQSLLLVGGNSGFVDATGAAVPGGVSVTNGSLVAPGGQINIVSVGKPAKPSIGGEVAAQTLTPSGFKNMGDVSLVRNSGDLTQISASGDGGKIVIRGGNIEVENYRIVADSGPGLASGDITIDGTTISLANKGNIPCFQCAVDSIRIGGNYGGDVTVTGSDSVTTNGVIIGGAIDPFAVFPTGAITLSAPRINVTATSFRIGGSRLTRGSLHLLGENITVLGASIYKGENFSPADVNIQAKQSVYIDGFNMQQLDGGGDLPGSSVSIRARDIEMTGARIETSHIFMDGLGDAGPITIAGQRNVSIANSEFSTYTVGVPRTGTPGVSDAGNITITAGKDLSVSNTKMTADTRWAGHAGDIFLGAGKNLNVEDSALSVNSTQTTTNFFGAGPAGNITIGAGKNVSVANTTLSANSQGPAQAGVIGIGAGKNVSIDQSSLSAEGLGGGADGQIVLGAGKNVTLQNGTVTPTPLILEP